MQIQKLYFFISILTISTFFACSGSSEKEGENTSQNTSTEQKTEVKTDGAKAMVASSEIKTSEEEKAETEKSEEKAEAEVEEKPVEEKKEEKKKVEKKKRAKIVFDEKVHDYGFIMQGDTVKHDFHFKNIGDDVLLLKRVEASCGCTVPDYPKGPIAPGETGKVSVTFNSTGKLGRQVPNISVFTNYNRRIKLELKGVVDTERAKPAQPIKEEVKVDNSSGL